MNIFTVQLLDKEEAQAAFSVAKLSADALNSGNEQKIIVCKYSLPLTSIQKMQIDQFEKSHFSRDTLSRKKGQAKSSSDNPRVTPKQEELGRIESNDSVTVYYRGRTGLLDALYNNSLVMDGDHIDALAQDLLKANAQNAISAQPDKKSSRGL